MTMENNYMIEYAPDKHKAQKLAQELRQNGVRIVDVEDRQGDHRVVQDILPASNEDYLFAVLHHLVERVGTMPLDVTRKSDLVLLGSRLSELGRQDGGIVSLER